MEDVGELVANALNKAFANGRAAERLTQAQNEFNEAFMEANASIATLMQAISPPDKKDVN